MFAFIHFIFLYLSRFFDTNPSGRIMNRFSADVAGIDQVHLLTFILSSTHKKQYINLINIDGESLYP